jgi:hypothetical protein
MFNDVLFPQLLVDLKKQKRACQIIAQQTVSESVAKWVEKVNEMTIAKDKEVTTKKKAKKRVHVFQANPVETTEPNEVPACSSIQLEKSEPVLQKVRVTTDQEIIKSCEQASAVTITLNDVCWICNEKWNEFVDLRLVTILPCLHSACSACLLKMLKSSNEKQKDGMGEFTYKFNCGICRLELEETVPYEAANQVLNKNLIPSFYQFISSGRSKEERRERRQLVNSLLVDQFEYDVQRVEATLFNLIEIMEIGGAESLTSGEIL